MQLHKLKQKPVVGGTYRSTWHDVFCTSPAAIAIRAASSIAVAFKLWRELHHVNNDWQHSTKPSRPLNCVNFALIQVSCKNKGGSRPELLQAGAAGQCLAKHVPGRAEFVVGDTGVTPSVGMP